MLVLRLSRSRPTDDRVACPSDLCCGALLSAAEVLARASRVRCRCVPHGAADCTASELPAATQHSDTTRHRAARCDSAASAVAFGPAQRKSQWARTSRGAAEEERMGAVDPAQLRTTVVGLRGTRPHAENGVTVACIYLSGYDECKQDTRGLGYLVRRMKTCIRK